MQGGILLPSPTTTRHGRREAKKPKKRSPVRSAASAVYIVLVLLSALIVGCYIAWNILVKPPEVNQEPKPEYVDSSSSSSGQSQDPDPGEPDDTVTGPQRREGVYNFVLLGRDKESANTDTIIIVSYDTVQQKVGMTSIPRDTIVRRDWSPYLKINMAYASQGPDMLKQEIENTFGIPIDYYIHINLNGFIALVDQLGGVDVYIPEDMNYDDPYQDLYIHYTKGNYHLTGQQAMEVVRFRDNNDGTGYTDVGRAAMQRQVLVNLAKKVLSWNSLTKVQNFIEIFQKYVTTDLSTADMLYFASQAINFDLDTGLTQVTLEGRGDGYYNAKNQWCYIFKAEDILPALNASVNPYDTDLTAEDLDLLEPARYYFNY